MKEDIKMGQGYCPCCLNAEKYCTCHATPIEPKPKERPSMTPDKPIAASPERTAEKILKEISKLIFSWNIDGSEKPMEVIVNDIYEWHTIKTSALREENEAMKKEVEELKEMLKNVSAKQYITLTDTIDSLKANNHVLQSDYSNLQNRNISLTAKIKEMEQQLFEKENYNKILQTEKETYLKWRESMRDR